MAVAAAAVAAEAVAAADAVAAAGAAAAAAAETAAAAVVAAAVPVDPVGPAAVVLAVGAQAVRAAARVGLELSRDKTKRFMAFVVPFSTKSF